ncbi:hypothetical protein CKK33_16505 [Mucilaginibacter sp. MD40]|uniref:glycosyltransferase family protein n=1 Tax=Mucilaginibacter sp. MD40 TaxID=2029590 RepID=UPI000BAC8FD7|nr:glycosyltransferase [Mucilaginibacter sp. MD40]PAW95010.1 hypothetical protein CKK33_16505 [Mucilaginibacter sp. MD40]
MKIVVFASLTKDTTANYIIRAFKRRGDSVFVFSDIDNPLVDKLIHGSPDVSALCEQLSLRPDLFLFIEGGSMQIFPSGLEHLPCLTAWYGIDTHMDYNKHLAICKAFDINFIAQYEYVPRLLSDGAKQVHWLPLAFEPQPEKHAQLERDLLISYIGSNNVEKHKERHDLIKAITDKYNNIFFGKAIPAEMSKIYARSWMVFNKSINNDINMRYFEAMGEGAVLLTDKLINNGVDTLFVDGEHYLVYNDKEHLLQLIDALSNDKQALMKIGQNAKALINDLHTYDARANQILEIVNRSQKAAVLSPISYFSIFISLGLISDALLFLILTLKSLHTGKFNKIIIKLISPPLYLIFKFTQTLNYFRKNAKKNES